VRRSAGLVSVGALAEHRIDSRGKSVWWRGLTVVQPFAQRHDGLLNAPRMISGALDSASPSRDASVVVSNGRRVQIAEWGPSDGLPLLFLHGTPGSRLLCPDVAATEAA